MDCQEITEVPVALRILQTPEDNRLQQLFRCIYSLFQGSFLGWILHKYAASSHKDKLWEDAKDAFQNGLVSFYHKAQDKNFSITGSLKTTIYSFGLLQLLALFKKEKRVNHQYDYLQGMELFFEDELLKDERHHLLNEKETDLLEALSMLPKKQKDILVMKFFQKLKSKEIAEKFNVSPGNVDNDASKAYKELRRILLEKFSFQKQEQWN